VTSGTLFYWKVKDGTAKRVATTAAAVTAVECLPRFHGHSLDYEAVERGKASPPQLLLCLDMITMTVSSPRAGIVKEYKFNSISILCSLWSLCKIARPVVKYAFLAFGDTVRTKEDYFSRAKDIDKKSYHSSPRRGK
jgi:hypothetical protein